VFLGHSVAQSKNVSEDTAKIIDSEVKRLVEEAKTKAKKILTDNIDQLHIIAKGLLEYETLTGDEIKDLLNGIKPSRDDLDGDIDKPTKTSPSVPKTGGSAHAPAN
jgi:cell division protease FtsH